MNIPPLSPGLRALENWISRKNIETLVDGFDHIENSASLAKGYISSIRALYIVAYPALTHNSHLTYTQK